MISLLKQSSYTDKAECFLNLRTILTTCQHVPIYNVKMLLKLFHYLYYILYEAP